jgi:hypothetical protein
MLLTSKSFSDDKNKAETLLQDFSLFCHFSYSASLITLLITNNARNMSKSTSYTGQPVYSQVFILLDKAQIQQTSLETLGGKRYVSV